MSNCGRWRGRGWRKCTPTAWHGFKPRRRWPRLSARPPREALTELAVDYQRLFGFGVPPYESVFLDPSAMLMAPATARVQAFYRRVGWRPPAGARVGAADHVGVELLLLADLMAAGRQADAERLVQEHLAFWIPPLVAAVSGLNPAPFYATLADRTLEAVLSLLPGASSPVRFPALPPPPRYEARGLPEPRSGPRQDDGLHEFVRALLTPREAGLYITRDDLGRLSRHVELPPVVADRRAMLMTMLRLAGQYDELPQVIEGLSRLLNHAANTYQAVAEAFPGMAPLRGLLAGTAASHGSQGDSRAGGAMRMVWPFSRLLVESIRPHELARGAQCPRCPGSGSAPRRGKRAGERRRENAPGPRPEAHREGPPHVTSVPL
ncbi:MAG: molecular chaperone TorD family protein [Ardenticatenia bacterium]|nr:molecular chaperone TorD family protein [Ardenticatenia bacterium]